MTATQTAAAAPIPSPAPAGPRRSRAWIWWVAIAVVSVLLVVAVATVVVGRDEKTYATLDPDNPGPNGTLALASVLDDHGVDVDVVRTRDQLTDADVDRNTTLVVSSTRDLNTHSAFTVDRAAADAARVVLVGADDSTLRTFALPATSAFTATDISDPTTVTGVEAHCTTPGVDAGDVVLAGSEGFRIIPDPSGSARTPVACFTHDDVSELIVVPDTTYSPEWVLISGAMLANDRITRLDNAGVGVRLFGSTDRIVWYVPTFGDGLATDDDAESTGDDGSDVPRAIGPLVLLSFFGLLALMVWRGRRFGPLVTEPLPAVVKAIETTVSRGRLYHAARADDRAAAQLRLHTLVSLGATLGLPFDSGPSLDTSSPDVDQRTGLAAASMPSVYAVVDAVAGLTRRDPTTIHALLAGPLPVDDEALVRFTSDLTTLEKEVRAHL